MRATRYLAALALSICVAAPAVAQAPDDDATLQSARDAMAIEDFETALTLLRPLAERGNAQAQVGLGTLYSGGMGVDQDYPEAARWFRLSADQGNALGQYNLAICYYKGQGVKADSVEALKWVSLSAMQGFPPARRIYASLTSELSKDEREEGKRRAREWKPR